MKFFELLTISSKTGLFEQICMALMRSYPWLSKELQSDLKNERGNLVIDQDVQKEASMIVHRLNIFLFIFFYSYLLFL